MKTIICFGDSNTHGYTLDNKNKRYGKNIRWTGLLSDLLHDCTVIEEGLNGRTSGFEDSIEPYRDASKQILPCIMSHAPLDLIIIMLGTNDTKDRYHVSAEEITYSMEELIRKALSHLHWTKQVTKILLVAPCPLEIQSINGEFSQQSIEKSHRLPQLLKRLSSDYSLHFFDASTVVSKLGNDGIHFSKENHSVFAHAIHQKIQHIFSESN